MRYHLSALLTVSIWSITYISTKVVLQVLTPLQLTMYRFIIGYLCLLIIRPPKTIRLDLKRDMDIILAGFFGIFIYYILENSATRLTQASYVSIIVSTIPLITSILAHVMNKDEKFSIVQIITFIIALSGISIIILEGSSLEKGVLKGNMIALSGAVIFSLYNIFLRRVDPAVHPIDKARKINFYGLLFIIIFFLITREKSIPKEVFTGTYLVNILFLGVIASSICILTWGYSISGMGAVKTSRYIYLAPLITNIASNLILHEKFTLYKTTGMILIVSAMLLPIIIGKTPLMIGKKPR